MMPLRSRRVRAILVLLALGLLAQFAAVSATAVGNDENAKPSLAKEYRLSAGDKINVTVFGQAALSGEYLIDGSGNITMPLAGRISVFDSTIEESERKIEEHLGDGYIRQPSISVRISEPRPIYIVGDVKRPGTYAYRYGSTVLSAIAVAGGYGGRDAMPGVAAAEFLLVDERVRLLTRIRLSLLIRQARVAAQLNDKDKFEAPILPDLAQQVDQLESIIAGERQVLAAQVEALKKEIDLQKAQKPTIKTAIGSVLKQVESAKNQLSLASEQLNNYAKLDKAKLSRRVVTIALQRDKAALESSIAELDADRARLDLMTGEIDIKIQDLEIAYRRRALAEMQDIRAKLMEIETALPTARELRELRARQASGVLSTNARDVPRTLLILRSRQTVVRKIAATVETILEPGDIVEVKRMRRSGDNIGGRPQAFATGLNASSKAVVAGQSRPSHASGFLP